MRLRFSPRLLLALALPFSLPAHGQMPQGMLNNSSGSFLDALGDVSVSGMGQSGGTIRAPGIQTFDSGTGTPTIRGRTGASSAATDSAPQAQPQAARPAAPPTEFQSFIEKAIGRQLPVFGANMFADSPATFAPAQDIPLTADYVIGAGDELVIRAWGAIDFDLRATVDRTGTITIPRVGTFPVAGVQYGQLNAHLQRQISRVFRNFELATTLGQIRSIRVYVVGHARRPGSYTVSALSTLVNAVIASGGPAAGGSLRRIEVRRGGRVVSEFDFYDLLLRGDKSKDVKLASEDVIWIGPIGEQVAMAGSVNQPAIYELRRGSTLRDAITWAGGLATTASGRRITLERIEQREHRTVKELAADETSLAQPLADGDLVTVYEIQRRFENVVTLRGNVARPMRFTHRSGMRVSSVIPDRRALVTNDFYLGREQIILPKVNDPNDTAADVRADVKRSIREPNWEYAVLERLREQDLTPELIPFNLGRALERDPQHDLVLEPGDVVTVFSRDDIALPVDRQTKFIRLEGEFRSAGVYRALPGETLRQIVSRVGGLSSRAYLFGAEFSRDTIRREQELKYQEGLRRMEQEVARAAVAPAGATLEDAQIRKDQIAAQQRLLERMRSVKPTGRIVLGLESPHAALKDLPDLPLQDGDRLYVPPLPESVSVYGSVFNEGSFLHGGNRRVGDYVNLAGGPTKTADRGSVFVIRASGAVESARQGGWLSGVEGRDAFPGDTVFVPENLERQPVMKVLRDWSQIFYQFGLGAAALKVLKN